MGLWSGIASLIDLGLVTSVPSIVTEYRKYGSIYRVLELNNSEADKSLGIGSTLESSLNKLPDVNADYLNQFIESPLNNIFTLYDNRKELLCDKDDLEHCMEHLTMYETLLAQGDTNQLENIQLAQANVEKYQVRINEKEIAIENNPMNQL